jgi:hypothetical protein
MDEQRTFAKYGVLCGCVWAWISNERLTKYRFFLFLSLSLSLSLGIHNIDTYIYVHRYIHICT